MSFACVTMLSTLPYSFEPFRGGLRAHLRYAGNVVRAVADEREVVDDLLGQHVELRLDAGAIELGVEHRVDAGDAVVDELRHVLVARRDHDLEPIGRRAFGERADDVVGFDALDPEQRQTESWNRFDQRLDLGAQIVRHRRPMRLVFLEEFVTESPPRRVEHDRDELRVLVLEELVQHVEHAKHGSGRHARLGREWRQGVKGAVEVGRAVYQPELAGLAHRVQPPGGWVSFFFSSSSAGTRISTGVSTESSGQKQRPGLAAAGRRHHRQEGRCNSHRSSIAIVSRETQMSRLSSSLISMLHTWLRLPRWIGRARPVT